MAFANQIRDLVSNYLFASVAVRDLGEQLDSAIEAAEAANDAEGMALGDLVDLRIARYFEGYISEESLRLQLNDVVPTLKVLQIAVADFQITVSTGPSITPAASGSMSLPLSQGEQSFAFPALACSAS